MRSDEVSMATISSRAVPTQTVAPSTEISALLAPGDCKTSGSRICGGAEDNGSARARGNAERTLGVRSDADRKSAKHHLDCAGKAIHGVHGDVDGGTCGTLRDGNRIRRQAESEVWRRRRRRRT